MHVFGRADNDDQGGHHCREQGQRYPGCRHKTKCPQDTDAGSDQRDGNSAQGFEKHSNRHNHNQDGRWYQGFQVIEQTCIDFFFEPWTAKLQDDVEIIS